jgi:AbrB family looped-hinge helix DNA binding protein
MSTGLKTAAVEFVATTRIGEKGQLTIPKEFREDLGLGAGAPFVVLRIGDGLILIPEQRRFEQLCRRVTSALSRGGVEPDTLLATFPRARKRVFDRHYGRLAPKKSGRHGHKDPANP